MPFWVLLIVEAVVTLISALLPKGAKTQTKPQTYDVPNTQAGDVIPLAFGTVKIPLRIVDYQNTDWHSQPIRRGPQSFLGILGPRPIVGQYYFASFIGLLGHGEFTQLIDILIDNKSVVAAGPGHVPTWTFPPGSAVPTISYTTVTANFGDTGSGGALMQFDGMTDVIFNADGLLGGDDSPGNGGAHGRLTWRNGVGHSTKIPNFLARRTDVPAWRSYAHLYFDDVYLGNSPILPSLHAIAVRAPRIGNSSIFDLVVTEVGATADGNPAAILWELLTDTETGAGLPEELLDLGQFRSLAFANGENTDVGFGLSFVVDNATPVSQVIDDVCRTADIALVTDPVTGLLSPWAIRAPNDSRFGYPAGGVSAIPLISPANARSLQYTPPIAASGINAVRVTYMDRNRNYTQNQVLEADTALVAQMGQHVVLDVEFLGVSNERMARRCAVRELKTQTTPLAKASIACDRYVAGVIPGKWVQLTWPEYGISGRIMRVVDVDFGTLEDPTVTIDCVDDVYAMPGRLTTAIITAPWVSSVPPAGQIAPDVQVDVAQTATVATIRLAVVDVQSRVTLVESRTYLRSAAPGAYATLAGTFPGYVVAVTLDATEDTIFEYRVSWTDVNGATKYIEETVAVPSLLGLAAPILSVEWTDNVTAVVTAVAGSAQTLSGVRFSSGTAAQTDVNVAAGTLDTTVPYSVTVTVPVGMRMYVGARAEGTLAGATALSPVVRRELVQSGSAAVTLVAELGNGITPLTATEREQVLWVDIGNFTVTGWSVSADVSGSVVVKCETATFAAFPTWTDRFTAERPTLTTAQKAQATLAMPLAVTTKLAFRFTIISATTITAVTVSLHGVRT